MQTQEQQRLEEVFNHLDDLAAAIRVGKGFTVVASFDGGGAWNAGGRRQGWQHLETSLNGTKAFIAQLRDPEKVDCPCGCGSTLDTMSQQLKEMYKTLFGSLERHAEYAKEMMLKSEVKNASQKE